MSSICHSFAHTSEFSNFPKPPSRRWSILPESDHRQLQRHLKRYQRDMRPSGRLTAHVLRHKIMWTKPVQSFQADDLATGGCEVIYSINGGPVQAGLLCHEVRSRTSRGVIPVCLLLGATLIGMYVGQRAPLLRVHDTVGSVSLLDVFKPG